MHYSIFALLTLFLLVPIAGAHDVWLETNTPLVRVGEQIDLDLKLGNHGNNHRDFKLASKVSAEAASLQLLTPSGKRQDLKPALVDLGYTPKEGYWSAPVVASEPGYYVAYSADGKVVNHGKPVRSIRSAKVYWLADKSLDQPARHGAAYRQPLGLPVELVCVTDPARAAVGQPLSVQLLRQGKPVVGQAISFIPRGVELADDFDPTYQPTTNQEGQASFTPKQAGLYLIVASQLQESERGAGYEATRYAATLTVRIARQKTAAADR
jgi:uncharacterized GH25 family protein